MIELRHLKYFVAVAEELNFRRAAERVHVDPTPVSRAVRDLEESLGVDLLIRSSRPLRLTPAGSLLLDELRHIFVKTEHALCAAREAGLYRESKLKIGIADGISQPRLVNCLARWCSDAPQFELDMTELSATELATALCSGALDAGFSFGVPETAKLVHSPAWSYPLMAILPADKPCASASQLSLAELDSSSVVLYSERCLPGLERQINAALDRHAVNLRCSARAQTLGGYFTRVAAGTGLGFADAGHVVVTSHPGIVSVPLREEESITTYLVHRPQLEKSSAAVQRFVAHVCASS